MNLIVQEQAKAAFVLTDTAYFDVLTGAVKAFGPKVHGIVIGEAAYVAVATSGRLFLHHVRPHLEAIRASTLREFLAAMPDAFRAGEADSLAEGGGGSCAAVIAAFDRAAGRAYGWGIGNNTMAFRARPYSLVPTRKYLTGFDEEKYPALADTEFGDPKCWNPAAQGVELLEAQRADDFDLSLGFSAPAVGGQAVLTRVDRDGINHTTLKAWPDRVGRPIDLGLGDRLGWRDRLQAFGREKLRPVPTLWLAPN
ncbi:hypothetical protein MRBLMA1_000525 [Sphingobium sp. LMA1-1-1.1]|uniref:hypothetical protein n=1 Tax=Sphingobium sp. LMA1-1-1.1 TaxID=3135238 RepID=UPI003413A411